MNTPYSRPSPALPIVWTVTLANIDNLATAYGELEEQKSIVAASNRDFHRFADFKLSLGTPQVGAYTAGGYLEMYLITSGDGGSTYEDGVTVAPAPSAWRGNFVLPADELAHQIILTGISIPPGPIKIVIVNKSGRKLNASVASITYRTYS